jgi:hypothetical protein
VKQRSRLKGEGAVLGAIDVGSRQVGRQQVGGELNAVKAPLNTTAELPDGPGLGQTRRSFDQQMAIGQQGDQQPLDQTVLPENGAPDLIAQCREALS